MSLLASFRVRAAWCATTVVATLALVGCVNQPWKPLDHTQPTLAGPSVIGEPLMPQDFGTLREPQGGGQGATKKVGSSARGRGKPKGTRASPVGVVPGAHPSAPPTPAVYYLPYRRGTSHVCVQPGPGPFSHKGTQRYAVDFGMSVGTPVHASRGGVVIAVKEDSNRGGSSESMARHGNYVRVQHSDGTSALYLHLRKNGARVNVGDVVRRGQHIADSGNTGWSAMPHLHFQVDRQLPNGQYSSIRIKFQDVGGDGVPGFLGSYRSRNRP